MQDAFIYDCTSQQAHLHDQAPAPSNRNPGGLSDARLRCEQGLLIKGATHAAATAFLNVKSTGTKVLGGLKAAAPAIGVYGEAGAGLLGASVETAAVVGASLSGAAEVAGGLTALYVAGTGAYDFYKYVTDPANSCANIP